MLNSWLINTSSKYTCLASPQLPVIPLQTEMLSDEEFDASIHKVRALREGACEQPGLVVACHPLRFLVRAISAHHHHHH